jgi:L-ascorbate metabolism protein UlaG (beta-lactamase superfamily)
MRLFRRDPASSPFAVAKTSLREAVISVMILTMNDRASLNDSILAVRAALGRGHLLRLFLGLTAVFLLSSRPVFSAEAPLAGDRIPTQDGDLIVHPVNHATVVLQWKDKTIYTDPVGGSRPFAGLPRPDLILLTDIHRDHLDAGTLTAVMVKQTEMVAPAAVLNQLPVALRQRATELTNGATKSVLGILIEAVPAYNLAPDRLQFHAKGRGNGYILNLGGKRIYLSGDTEDIPEMRALKAIDVAFVCMNLPYTMDVKQAAGVVREFRPKIVYPYHYRGSDLEQFKKLVGNDSGVEVRVRDWYAP